MTYYIVTLKDDTSIICLTLESVELIPDDLLQGLTKIEANKAA